MQTICGGNQNEKWYNDWRIIVFIKWSLKRRGVYLLFFIRWVEIKTNTRRKMEREEKHWEVGNFNMTLFHKKDGKLWFRYLQCRGEIKMKSLFCHCVLQDWQQENWKERKCAKNTPSNAMYSCLLLQLLDTM